jgi:hypothetical protein
MEPENSLPHSQVPATRTYPDPLDPVHTLSVYAAEYSAA